MINELISDQYGNYGIYFLTILVVQKALQSTNGIKFMEIIDIIKKNLKHLRHTNYGKKIYDNLINNYGEYLIDNKNAGNNLKKKNLKNISITEKVKKESKNKRNPENSLIKINQKLCNNNTNNSLMDMNNKFKDILIDCDKNSNSLKSESYMD